LAALLVAHHRMHTIGGDGAIENAQPTSLAGNVQPSDPGLAIARKFEQELLAVAAVRACHT